MSKDDCGACQLVKAGLAAAGIDFTLAYPCDMNRTTGCFQGGNQMAVPLLMIVDAKGRIAYARYGWNAMPRIEEGVVREIKNDLSSLKNPSKGGS